MVGKQGVGQRSKTKFNAGVMSFSEENIVISLAVAEYDLWCYMV